MKSNLITLLVMVLSLNVLYGQNCPPGATTSQRDNKLFLYFPTTSDNTFPEYSAANTSPLEPFNVSDLDAGIGTTLQLRNRITEIVTEDYCEFNVEVIPTTTAPNTTGIARWQIVGIGSDNGTVLGRDLFGVAQDVDLGDGAGQDYARVYAGSFGNAYGGTGGVLAGSNSTLERWATALGHTTSHEAGHNYGLAHCDAGPRTGEDGSRNHIMNTSNPRRTRTESCGFNGVTDEDRASRRRHFSDQSYEILAHNIGLNVKTLYNWDFANPNSDAAHSMEITLLSTAPSLTISWWYNGSRSPWRNPTISSSLGSKTFQGTTYNEFLLTFSVDKSWSNGNPGIAPPGVEFHTGASFVESDPVIVYDTKLKNNGGADLPLHPRMIGFDAGSMDLSTGDFSVSMFNPNHEEGDLIIQDFTFQFLPRLVDIESMLENVPLQDIRGLPVNPYSRCTPMTQFELAENQAFRLASLTDNRFVDITYNSDDCEPGIVASPNDGRGIEVVYCPNGTALSLFPSTAIYISATIVDPNANYYDPDSGFMVTGPLTSKVFYQFAGIVPDFNNNGEDDLIDIRTGVSKDVNSNGVVDEVDPEIKPSAPLRLPFGLGTTIPLGNFDDDYDPGLFIELKANFPIASFGQNDIQRLRLSLNAEGGIYSFEQDSTNEPFNIWGGAIGPRLDYEFYRFDNGSIGLFADINAGLYQPTNLDWRFGWNYGGGLSARVGSVFVDLGYSQFMIREEFDFRGVGLSLGLNL